MHARGITRGPTTHDQMEYCTRIIIYPFSLVSNCLEKYLLVEFNVWLLLFLFQEISESNDKNSSRESYNFSDNMNRCLANQQSLKSLLADYCKRSSADLEFLWSQTELRRKWIKAVSKWLKFYCKNCVTAKHADKMHTLPLFRLQFSNVAAVTQSIFLTQPILDLIKKEMPQYIRL